MAFPSPQLEELRSRLSQVADALFSRSARLHGTPFTLSSHSPPTSSTPTPSPSESHNLRLLSLCGGPGRADWVLQHLSQNWASLSSEKQNMFRDDIHAGLSAMLKELRRKCERCEGEEECIRCRYMVSSISEKLERLAETVVGKLEVERSLTLEEEDAVPEAVQDSKLAPQEVASMVAVNEQLSRDIEVLKEERKSAREALGVALHQLDKAASNIEWYAKDLEASKRWKTAAEIYSELAKMKIAKLERQDGGALSDAEKGKVRKEAVLFKHRQVAALMKAGSSSEAETLGIAEELWEDVGAKNWMGQEGILLFEATSREMRDIHEDYCTILRANKRYEDAERECMFVWYLPQWWVDKDPRDDFRYDAAYRIAGIVNERKNAEEAVVWYRKIVGWALEMSPRRMKRAARSGVKLTSLLESLKRGSSLVQILDPIWTVREADDNSDDILNIGFELGSRLLEHRAEKAAPILKGVWEGMKATKHKKTMDAAELLAKAYGSLEKDEELEQLYPWIIDNLTDEKKLERNKYRYALGYVQFTREKDEAEATLRKAWQELEQDPRYGRDHRDTLQSGLLLGQVLVKKGCLPEAQAFLKAAWEGGHKYPKTTLLVRAGEFYSDALALTGHTQDLDAAERVLAEVWNIATRMSLKDSVRDKSSVLWPALLSAGECYGRLLLDRQKGAVAEGVLAKIVKLRKDLGYGDLDEAQSLVEEAKRMQQEVPSSVAKEGGLPGLDPPKVARPRSVSRRRQPRKRPGFLSDVAWWMLNT